MLTTQMGHPAPARFDAGVFARALLKGVIENLAELLIINLTIWVATFAAIVSFAGLLPPDLSGTAIFSVVFGLPALWATSQTLNLAMTPKSTEVSHPISTDFE